MIAEQAAVGPLIVVLDEVETLASDRSKMSMEANPVDVHRATDAVLAQLDQLATQYPKLLFIATSNFEKAIDAAFVSRADLVEYIGLPTAEACGRILTDTVMALADVYPRLKGLVDDPAAGDSERCRSRRTPSSEIRSGSLCTRKRTALDPGRLTASDILASVEQAQRSDGEVHR